MKPPEIYMSKRFRRAYQKASVPLQRLIEGATHDLVHRLRESPENVKRKYDRLAHLQPQLGLLEVDVSGANRMVAEVEQGNIHLLDVGNHETVPRYTFGKYQTDKHQREEAQPGFWPDVSVQGLRFFTSNPCQNTLQFGTELSAEWLYFLSAQQSDVLDETMEHIFASHGSTISPVFIVGGPGTGKTSILINVLKQFVDLGQNARMRCSCRMKDFIIASTPSINADLLVTDDEACIEDLDLLIVDDPDTSYQISEQIKKWLVRNGRLALIIGFDPCQIQGFDSKKRTSGLDDESFDQLVSLTNANVFGLDECYRQKQNVGLATQKSLRLLAESTPFLAEQKKHEFRNQHLGVNSLGHEFSFPNPHGYTQVYPKLTGEGLQMELDRIRRLPRWHHWPSTLAVVDSGLNVDAIRSIIQDEGIECDAVRIGETTSIKGLEYQHLLLFLSNATFHDLENGFEGSGQAKYANYRLMRIPLSRPKDSLVVFVWDT